MNPRDARLVVVRVEIERDFVQVQKHLERAQSVDPRSGELEAAYVALALDHAYQAFENMLLAIEKALRLPERHGERWHRAVLADATLALPRVRPAIVPTAAERDWEELLGFRHFLRHAYAADLDPERLAANVARLTRAFSATAPCVEALLEVLESTSEDET